LAKSELSENWEKKLEKLDNAFLFIISLVGLLFTIVQVYREGVNGLIEISPLLVLGVALPFYVGYIRGAIEYGDSLTERVRGWVYLTVGVNATLGFFLSRVNIGFYWLLLVLGLVSIYCLERWLNSYFRLKENITSFYAFSLTAVAGFCLAYASSYMITVYFVFSILLQLPTITLLLSSILQTEFFLIIFLFLEIIARQLADVSLPLKPEEIEQRQKSNFLTKIYYCVGELFVLAFRQDYRILYFFVGGFILSLATFLILFVTLMFSVTLPFIPDVLLIGAICHFALVLILFFKTRKIDFSKFKFKASFWQRTRHNKRQEFNF
jgi:hypothetical protein